MRDVDDLRIVREGEFLQEKALVILSEAKDLVFRTFLERPEILRFAQDDKAFRASKINMLRRIRVAIATILLLCLAPLALASEKPQPSPLEFLEAMSRAALKNAGAEQLEVEGPDGKLVYWAAGEGPVVILVHGTNDQAGLWWRTVAALKNRYRVIAIDMPGHGESGPSEGALDMSMMSEAVRTIADTVSPDEPVILIGNSMGGWASLLYALDNPGGVKRLILESPGGISLDTPPTVTLLPKTIEEARAGFDAALGPDGLIPDPVLEDFVRRAPTSPAARLSERSWDEYLLDDRLGALEVPVALIWGEEDGILPLSYAEKMKSMIDGATLTVIPGCGHIPHNECSEQFIEAVSETLGDTK